MGMFWNCILSLRLFFPNYQLPVDLYFSPLLESKKSRNFSLQSPKLHFQLRAEALADPGLSFNLQQGLDFHFASPQ